MNLNLYQNYLDATHFYESLSNISPNINRHPHQSFKRAKKFLQLLGHPDQAYKIIHIAGTSGKGSTAKYISTILQNAGFKVGTHYSPFVSVPTEKIQINSKFISVNQFISLTEKLKPTIEKLAQKYGAPAYSETWAMAALLYFKEQKVDWVVLETGCGGHFDATNAISKKEFTIITDIGLDHQHILGDTIEEIAFEKAGIIPPHGTVITTTCNPDALKIIQRVADRRQASLEMIFTTDDPNQAIATHLAQHLGINDKTIIKSLQQPLSIPARFEIMQNKPIVIFDGAHNIDKIKFLTQKLKETFDLSKYNLKLICALTENRDPKEIFKPLKPLTQEVYCTRFLNPFRAALAPQKLANYFKTRNFFIDPHDALRVALNKPKKNDLILITGSFFLCSDLRSHWIPEISQLEKQTNFPKK